MKPYQPLTSRLTQDRPVWVISTCVLLVSVDQQSALSDVGGDPVVDDHGRPQQDVFLDIVVESSPALVTQHLTDTSVGLQTAGTSHLRPLEDSSVGHGSSDSGQTPGRAVSIPTGVLAQTKRLRQVTDGHSGQRRRGESLT